MKCRKITAAILSCTMLTSVLPMQVSAKPRVDPIGDEIELGDLFYLNHGDHIEITCTNPVAGEALVIPEEIDGLPVTAIAENAFEYASYTQIIWPTTIPVIPKGVFNNCQFLYTLILPDTVTEIEDGAFAECAAFGDIFYDGDAAAWDEVIIGGNNDALENANIHLEYTWTDEEVEFVEGEDNWSFSNRDLEGYLLTTEFVDRITEGFCSRYQEGVHAWSENLAAIYKGACGGMALVSFLVSHGVLDPSDIYEGAETLYEIPLCDESVQMITYYFEMTSRNELMDHVWNETYFNANFEAFTENLNNSVPAFFCYFLPERGMHAVVAYGIEEGEWTYGDTTYTGRFLIYDNNLIDCVDEGHLYFTENFEELYIPYWESIVYFSCYIMEPDYYFPYSLNMAVPYESTYALGDVNVDAAVDAADASELLIAAAASGSGASSGLNNGQKSAADVDADKAYNATDAALILEYAAYAGSGGTLTLEEYFRS